MVAENIERADLENNEHVASILANIRSGIETISIHRQWLKEKCDCFAQERQGRGPHSSSCYVMTNRSPFELVDIVVSNLSDDLLDPKFRGGKHPVAGHCYVASEALYHLLGGRKSGWVPTNVRHEGVSHWFLRHRETGFVLDPTVEQFSSPVPYKSGRGRGFLTREPSKRAGKLLARIES